MAFAASALTGLLALSHAAASGDPYAAAIERAQRNAATPAGHAYIEPLVGSLGPSLQDALKRCFPKTTAMVVPTRFAIAIMVDAEGGFAEMLVQPNSPQTHCVLDGIRTVQVAAPPGPNWWVLVHMKVEE